MSVDLDELLRRRIALAGTITVADFMVEALAHPTLGYYRRARAVGAAGDFVTAPEISQMFGELTGAWLAQRWLDIGRPDPVRLVELILVKLPVFVCDDVDFDQFCLRSWCYEGVVFDRSERLRYPSNEGLTITNQSPFAGFRQRQPRSCSASRPKHWS